MDIESFRTFCLQKKGTTEEFPFGENILVMKVMGKMYALTDIDLFESLNLKTEPEVNAELCERYPAVSPGYHMNKKHWITVRFDGSISDALLKEWIDKSYALVVLGLTKSAKSRLDSL